MGQTVGLPPLPAHLVGHPDWPKIAGAMVEFATIAVLAERERCAKLCEARASFAADYGDVAEQNEAMACAAAIRKGA